MGDPGLSSFAPSLVPSLGPTGLRSLSRVRRTARHTSHRFSAHLGPESAGPRPVPATPALSDRAHLRLRPSLPAASGGGSLSQISSPGDTIPSTRRPSANSARERVWRPRRRTALAVPAEAHDPVLHRLQLHLPQHSERLESVRHDHVRSAGNVVRPAALGVYGDPALTQLVSYPVDPAPTGTFAAHSLGRSLVFRVLVGLAARIWRVVIPRRCLLSSMPVRSDGRHRPCKDRFSLTLPCLHHRLCPCRTRTSHATGPNT